MNMKGKTDGIRLDLEVLSPLQCGSGDDLCQDSDYVIQDKQVFVIDQAQSFEALALGDEQLKDYYKPDELASLTDYRYGYALKPWKKTSKGSDATPNKIRAHQKDAQLKPYIPGSAIKGAIRTALLADYLRSCPEKYKRFLPTSKDKSASGRFLEHFLGKEPKENIFRALHVKDAIFDTEALCLVDIRWLNLTGKHEAQWRSMAGYKSFSSRHEADGIFAEMLKPESKTSFLLQWDGFLLSDLSRWRDNEHPDILPKNFDELKTKLNFHARHRLTQEIAFYNHYGATAPKQKCQEFLYKLNNDSDGIYLQLSWGSGWRGMTGDWMDEESMQKMRNLHGFGKQGMPFPKTRRLAVSGGPNTPLGWVRLTKNQTTIL